MIMKAITDHYPILQATVKTLKAGSDIILIAHDNNQMQSSIQSLKIAIKNGVISEERINSSVGRIIQLKTKYKLNNSKTDNVNVDELNLSISKVLKKYD